MLRRIGAVIFAVIVLLVATGVREERAEQTLGDDERPGDTTDPYEIFDGDDVDLVCVEELRQICEDDLPLFGFATTIEPVWVTVDRLADGGDLGADLWLTFRPFDSLLVDSATSTAGALPPPVVARSLLVITGPQKAIAALDAACPEDATRFACAAQRPKSLVLNDPKNSALGVLALAVLAYSSGASPASVTIDDPALRDSLGALTRTARRSPSPYLDATRLAGETVAVTLEADVISAVEDVPFEEQETFDEIGVRYPLDVRAVEVVLASSPTFRRTDDLARLTASRNFSYQFDKDGFATEERPFFFNSIPVFKGRPPTRTDLNFSLEFLKELRGVA